MHLLSCATLSFASARSRPASQPESSYALCVSVCLSAVHRYHLINVPSGAFVRYKLYTQIAFCRPLHLLMVSVVGQDPLQPSSSQLKPTHGDDDNQDDDDGPDDDACGCVTAIVPLFRVSCLRTLSSSLVSTIRSAPIRHEMLQ